MHFYNVVRILQRIYAKTFKVKEKASIIKCILVDCYFCIAMATFIASQYLFLSWKNECQMQMPLLRKWLRWEAYYQYGVVFFYFITSTIVIIYIVNQNTRIIKNMKNWNAEKVARGLTTKFDYQKK